MKPESDLETLLAQAHQFDPRALSALHDLFYPQVFRYVSYRIEDQQTCEDLTSEVFIRLLDFFKNKHGNIHKVKAWMLSTANHLIQDHYRASYRRQEEWIENHENIPSRHSPEEEFDKDFTSQELRRALVHLTGAQQHVITLRFSQEMSLQETAETMNKSIEAVKVLQFRALAALRRQLDKAR